MSRIPQSSVRSPVKTPAFTPSKPRSGATTPVRTRTKSTTARSATKPVVKDEEPPAVPAAPMSIKEAIALKRAEAKKLQSKGGGSALDNVSSLEDAIPVASSAKPEEDALGRWPVRETIERGRNTGAINLSSRSLPCLPSALFEIHLGITPDPLKSVANEPELPPSDPSVPSRRAGKRDNPAWFEAQDLQTLKAWNNEIVEIQHEISLFGSLKIVDLHANQISSLPASFGDLTALTTLDLSHNALMSIPTNIFTFPELTTLNLSHNQLTALPFNAPFASGRKQDNSRGASFFVPVVTRSTTPLPRLVNFNASHNKLTASGIDLELPTSLFKVDLSFNPLGESLALVKRLGSLSNLKELRLEHADIDDTSFPADLTPSAAFPRLRILDLGETKVNLEAVQAAMKGLKQELSFDVTTEDPPEGVTRVIVGKKVIREAWEIEAERKAKARAAKLVEEEGIQWGASSQPNKPKPTTAAATREVVKEAWEIEAEQGLLTEGGKRRARAQAAAATAASSQEQSTSSKPTKPSKPVKEAWEIEAEQGLLTEGGKRRARAAAAAAASEERTKLGQSSSSPSPAASLANSQYYSEATNTLTLPPSSPPSKTLGHGRAFSMAVNTSAFEMSPRTSDLAVPIPTAPLAEISAQPFSLTLRVLKLVNRRADRTITLPPTLGSALLPSLEELDLEGCNFPDSVSVSRASASGSGSPNRSTELLLPLLTSLFPNLRILNLSYNTLTSACLTTEALSALILAAPHRKGLKQLMLRGNRITDLNGFQGIAELFKGNRDVPGWKLDELDLRDNDIAKLPAELGLLPLDVFLVDGNAFRAPPRRIWEREGTKGLLSWLRGRIE